MCDVKQLFQKRAHTSFVHNSAARHAYNATFEQFGVEGPYLHNTILHRYWNEQYKLYLKFLNRLRDVMITGEVLPYTRRDNRVSG